jgi:hypothetical protein
MWYVRYEATLLGKCLLAAILLGLLIFGIGTAIRSEGLALIGGGTVVAANLLFYALPTEKVGRCEWKYKEK